MNEMHQIACWLLEAGDIALRSSNAPKRVAKADGSALSEADIAIDNYLRKRIYSEEKDAIIQSEEGGGPQTGKRWIIDSLDGTASYFEGLAHWGPVIGKVDANDSPLMGAMYLPKTSEFCFAKKGVGAFFCGQQLSSVDSRPVPKSPVAYVPSRFPFSKELAKHFKLRNLGSTSTHLCHVAATKASVAIIPPGWSKWDVVAGELLLNETKALIWSPCGHGFRGNRPLIVAGQAESVNTISKILINNLSFKR